MKTSKIIDEIFSSSKSLEKPLFIFELANNHMGDVLHGRRIISEITKVSKQFPFYFAFKFQFRHIPTFIHPDYINKNDHKYVKRFTETALVKQQFASLKNIIDAAKCLSIATPFDEASVDLIEKLNIPIIKIASCSFTDWPLLEKIISTKKPVIASTAGVAVSDIDKVVSFFTHRSHKLILLHCVGEYPTPPEHLNLNQITFLQKRYSGIQIGFSTHEDPNNTTAVQLAIAKGVRIFEKHVGITTEKYPINAYSATPHQVRAWLLSAQQALSMCGVTDKRSEFSDKEIADLRQFQRGVFAKETCKKGSSIESNDVFYAFPNLKNQLVANDMSKYNHYTLKRALRAGEPIYMSDVQKSDTREKVYKAVKAVHDLIKESGIAVPQTVELEVSHHYGMDKFQEIGLTMMTIVNREYCKKLIIMLPGQEHPMQYHKKKEETFNILYGEFSVTLNGKKSLYKPGDVVTIERNVKHKFSTRTGGILEEISSTHYVNDSYYTDESIMKNPNRKTFITYWTI